MENGFKKGVSSRRGFTLVELVVVIAIIGVLAAILVPSMLSYVRKAKLRAANSNAKTAYNAAAEFIADKEVRGISRTTAISYFGNEAIDCTRLPTGTTDKDDAQRAVARALIENGNAASTAWVGEATVNGVDSFFVQWCGEVDYASSGAIFGQYPDPISWETWKKYEGKTQNEFKWGVYYSESSLSGGGNA